MTQTNFKRILPTPDIIAFGGLSVVVDIGMTIALATTQEWGIGAILGVSLCTLGFNGVALTLFLRRWLTKPDFITKQGTSVWTAGIKEITKALVEDALDFYLASLMLIPDEIPDQGSLLELFQLAIRDKVALRKSLKEMLNGATIEFRSGPVTVLWPYTGVIKAYELQLGKKMIVQWLGSISNSAFFHGLQHMVDEIVLGEQPDYKHKDSSWWALVEKFNKEFGK